MSNLDALLAKCASEPIHIPGSIQPHGALLALSESDLTVVQASANLEDVIGVRAEDAIGRNVADVLPDTNHHEIYEALRTETLIGFSVTVRAKAGRRDFDGILHRIDELVMLELEPCTGDGKIASFLLQDRVRRLVRRLHDMENLEDTYNVIAEEIQDLTGFDRALIYRFDADWNGCVVGEAKQPDMESYLNLHYPASDIPAQARRLYEKNWLRLIPNVNYSPAPLVPGLNPRSNQPTDLSFAVLRSVSPVHLEYLRNMGVQASMSISIMKDNTLWGLITCTHRTPLFVPYQVRSACEFIGQALSVKLIGFESNKHYEERLKAGKVIPTLKQEVADLFLSNGPTRNNSPRLLDLVSASGAAVIMPDHIVTLGETPSRDHIQTLATWLRQRTVETVYATESLPKTFAAAEAFRESGCGILAISLGGEPARYVIWFRPEVVTTVKWGGNPHKPVETNGGEQTLSPRKSFEQWQEQLRFRAESWLSWEVEAADELRRETIDAVQRTRMELSHAALEVERSKLHNLNVAKDEFLAIVSHELRSPLNVIVGYAELLRHEIPQSDGFNHAIDAIMRNAKTQAQLIADLLDASRIISGKLTLDPTVVLIKELVSDAVDSVRFAASTKNISLQIDVDETLEHIVADSARLKQILWNLLTNAIKFTPNGGRVSLTVRRKQSAIEFQVTDTGQGIESAFLTRVFDRFKQESATVTKRHGGLGLGLSIVKNIAELHGGSVFADSAGKGKGATFSVTIPTKAVVSEPTVTEPRQSTRQADRELAGFKILVIDDEIDARQLVATVLEHRGSNVKTAATVADALRLVSTYGPDVIICDINLGEEDGYSFVRALRRSERESKATPIPVLALTAYAGATVRQEILIAGFQAMLAKPVLSSELTKVVLDLGVQAKSRNS